MTKFSSKVNRFFYQNQRKGIPNLMLFIAIGNLIVYFLYNLNRQDPIFYLMLIFDRASILQGQVWRIFTYPLVFLTEHGLLFGVIGLLFYSWAGNLLEQFWGTLRFNVYYFSGVLLTALAGLLLDAYASVYYVNLSLFLALATLIPDQEIRIYFVIPVKIKWLALLDLGLTLYYVVRGMIHMFQTTDEGLFLGWLLPIVALLNYILFFGRNVKNILPDFVRSHPTRKSWQREVKQGRVYADQPRAAEQARFRCTVCGRTEKSNPELEFRYCSKCQGYRCYCQDHINNHTHF